MTFVPDKTVTRSNGCSRLAAVYVLGAKWRHIGWEYHYPCFYLYNLTSAKSRFVPPFGGLRGNVHGSSVARWKARGRLPISANGTFLLALTMRRYERILAKSLVFEKGWVTLSANFRERGVVHQRLLASVN